MSLYRRGGLSDGRHQFCGQRDAVQLDSDGGQFGLSRVNGLQFGSGRDGIDHLAGPLLMLLRECSRFGRLLCRTFCGARGDLGSFLRLRGHRQRFTQRSDGFPALGHLRDEPNTFIVSGRRRI